MTDDVARFIERFGAGLEDAGMARMPARVFVALLTTDSGRMTSAQLAERLQISPAAVSGAIRYLIQVRLVTRERDPGSRRDVYALHDDLWYEAIVKREPLLTRWEEAVAEGVEAVGPDTPAGQRLAQTGEFFRFLQTELEALLARWREQQRS